METGLTPPNVASNHVQALKLSTREIARTAVYTEGLGKSFGFDGSHVWAIIGGAAV